MSQFPRNKTINLRIINENTVARPVKCIVEFKLKSVIVEFKLKSVIVEFKLKSVIVEFKLN